MSKTHFCPWWLGYFLINPVRKYRHNPDKILAEYVKPGMKVVDFGSAMGWFSLPMAKMVGESGKVFCFDIQEKMLSKLEQRAVKAGVRNIIEPRLIEEDRNVYSDINGTIDFALLCAVAHEVPDQQQLFNTLYSLLKPNGKLLFMEPAGHVTQKQFEQSIAIAQTAGFTAVRSEQESKNLKVILIKHL
jgi:ubiquinone/menaquinone biosynthesis C-methylase UbiE